MMEDLCAHCDIPKETMIHAALITLPVQTALVIDANIYITAKGNV